jgi:DNA-binding HxlR family transcriptional regulator
MHVIVLLSRLRTQMLSVFAGVLYEAAVHRATPVTAKMGTLALRAILWEVSNTAPARLTGMVNAPVSSSSQDLEDPRTASIGCPVARTANLFSNRWTPLILRDLADGSRRFGALQRSLAGISPKTLSERLKRLEESNVVARTCFAEVPPRVEYELTDKGHALLPIIEAMRLYGSTWLADEPC